MSSKIRIGGVPEHFNILWHYAIEKGYFAEAGIELVWTNYPSGSSPMARDLDANVIDVAVVLTESILASILNGNNSKIVSWYVTSPLVWGIHVGANSNINNTEELAGKKYAVSRMGSGSHLMALVDAENRNLIITPEQFVIVNNLDGAVEALPNGRADIFLWEKFTTKPWVDNGIFKRIGECPTPWPCFVIAVRSNFLETNKEDIKKMLEVIYRTAKEFRELNNATEMISHKYNLKLEDVNEWFKTVSWALANNLDKNDFVRIIERLKKLGVVTEVKNIDQVVERM